MAHSQTPSDSGGSIPASSLHFWMDDTDAAMALVQQYHYSHRWPSNVQFVMTAHLGGGLFGNRGEAVAAVVFTMPGTRWSRPVIELARLVRADGMRVPLSSLVGMAVRKIRARGAADLLVSFADATQGHHGGVYQACGWHYDGQRAKSMDGVTVAGEFVPGRVANHRWGTRSPDALLAMGIAAVPHYDEGKHLYWKAITPKGQGDAVALKLRSVAYPKRATWPARGLPWGSALRPGGPGTGLWPGGCTTPRDTP